MVACFSKNSILTRLGGEADVFSFFSNLSCTAVVPTIVTSTCKLVLICDTACSSLGNGGVSSSLLTVFVAITNNVTTTVVLSQVGCRIVDGL